MAFDMQIITQLKLVMSLKCVYPKCFLTALSDHADKNISKEGPVLTALSFQVLKKMLDVK